MNVLLLGEYSGFHKFLKEGLLELGDINVVLAANGDGWKKINGSDLELYNSWSSNQTSFFVKRCYDVLLKPYSVARHFINYDVVQLMTPILYIYPVNENLVSKIIKNNNIVSLVEAGGGYRTLEAYNRHMFDYYVYDYMKPVAYDRKTLRGKLNIHASIKIEEKSDIIIPCSYEYMIGYKAPNCYSVIPIPINVKGIQYRENKVGNKIVFFHGINREADKGTPFIRAALERLKEKYPKDVEVIVNGRMPYNEYIQVIERANVVIDQCCGYAYGINACVSMAQGKVVLSGNRSESRKALGVDQCPIIHIQPDIEQIYRQLVYIVEHKNEITQIGYKSRKYVEEIHDHVLVAQKYVEAWKSTGKL